MAANARYEQEVVQRLSGGLAGHIAGANELDGRPGLEARGGARAVRQADGRQSGGRGHLLDLDGRVVGDAAPPGQLKLDRVDCAARRARRRHAAHHGRRSASGATSTRVTSTPSTRTSTGCAPRSRTTRPSRAPSRLGARLQVRRHAGRGMIKRLSLTQRRRVRAAAVLLRRIGLAADGGQRPLRAGSGAAPVGRAGRTYRRRQRTDGRPGLEARGGARAVRQADGRQSGGRGLSAGPGRPRCRRCRAAGPAQAGPCRPGAAAARWPAACCPSCRRAGGSDIGYVCGCRARPTTSGPWPCRAAPCCAPRCGRSRWWRCWAWSPAWPPRPITRAARLTRAVRAFDGGDSGALAALEDGGKDGGQDGAPDAARGGDEIVACGAASRRWAAASGAMARADAPGSAAPRRSPISRTICARR